MTVPYSFIPRVVPPHELTQSDMQRLLHTTKIAIRFNEHFIETIKEILAQSIERKADSEVIRSIRNGITGRKHALKNLATLSRKLKANTRKNYVFHEHND